MLIKRGLPLFFAGSLRDELINKSLFLFVNCASIQASTLAKSNRILLPIFANGGRQAGFRVISLPTESGDLWMIAASWAMLISCRDIGYLSSPLALINNLCLTSSGVGRVIVFLTKSARKGVEGLSPSS